MPGPDGAVYYTANSGGEVRRLAVALTVSDALLQGKALTLRDNASKPAQKSLTITSKDLAISLGSGAGSADDPTVNGGSLRVVSTPGGFDNTYPLPKTGWSYIGKPGEGEGLQVQGCEAREWAGESGHGEAAGTAGFRQRRRPRPYPRLEPRSGLRRPADGVETNCMQAMERQR